jgi:hypothetical protein
MAACHVARLAVALSLLASVGSTPLPPGAPCTDSAGCALGACLGGYCCAAGALAANCSACVPLGGGCATLPPGRPCATGADCTTSVCLGGCCCSPGATPSACSRCACWDAAPTVPALQAEVDFGGGVVLPEGAVPLAYLPAGAPANPEGVDIVVALGPACAAFAAMAGSPYTCDTSRAFRLGDAVYYYVGSASAVRLVAAGLGRS